MECAMESNYLYGSVIIHDPLFTFMTVSKAVIMLAIIANLQMEEH